MEGERGWGMSYSGGRASPAGCAEHEVPPTSICRALRGAVLRRPGCAAENCGVHESNEGRGKLKVFYFREEETRNRDFEKTRFRIFEETRNREIEETKRRGIERFSAVSGIEPSTAGAGETPTPPMLMGRGRKDRIFCKNRRDRISRKDRTYRRNRISRRDWKNGETGKTQRERRERSRGVYSGNSMVEMRTSFSWACMGMKAGDSVK